MKVAKSAKIEKRWYASQGYSLDFSAVVIDLQEVDVAITNRLVRVATRGGVRGLVSQQWRADAFCPLSATREQALARFKEQMEREIATAKRKVADFTKLLADVDGML